MSLESKIPQVTFKHGARHLEGTELDIEIVEKAIRSDIVSKGVAEISKLRDVTINVEGTNLIYRPYVLKDGTINVGTYFIPK